MKKKAYREMGSLVLLTAVILVWAFVVTCGGGGDGGSSSTGSTGSTGTVNTSISDPPTCKADFSKVWVTITRVRAHKSPSADSKDGGWVDLADLRDKPQQIDLLSLDSDACILTMLGSTSGISAGQYQQIRLYLLSNSPASGEKTPQPNMCEDDSMFNCVVLSSGGTEILELSSEAQTGIKIPSGQIAGGRFTIPAGQVVDLNIHFDACSSIVPAASGKFRLKPVLHAGEISLITNAAISGRVVENGNPDAPIENAIVLIERKDSENIDRVIMQKLTDSDGKFIFCPLVSGTYDVVVGGKNGGPIYVPTITLGVGLGTGMGNIPLYAASGSATISGQVTAQIISPGKEVDIDISALQNADASLRVTVPVLQGSTPTTVTTVSGTANYSLSVPAGNPQVGSFSSVGTSYSQVPGDYLINARASNCTQSSLLTSSLTVISGGNFSAPVIAFTGCSGN